jgi:hypothetical protein
MIYKMKKVLKSVSVFALSGLVLFVSCSKEELVNNETTSVARLTKAEQSDLESRIAKDANFDALHQIFDDVLVSADGQKIQSLDKDRLLNEGDAYVAEVSGLSIEKTTYVNENIAILTTAIFED